MMSSSFRPRRGAHQELNMLHYAVVFFVIALIAALGLSPPSD